jgi:transcriptional regulator with XRE-family HTH domain
MKLSQYQAELRSDPEFLAAEESLRPYLEVADDILTLRLDHDWSQTELARHANTNQANISRLEAGLANPTIAVLVKVAEALDAEVVIRLRPRVDRRPVAVAPENQVIDRSDQVSWTQEWMSDVACHTVWDDRTPAKLVTA